MARMYVKGSDREVLQSLCEKYFDALKYDFYNWRAEKKAYDDIVNAGESACPENIGFEHANYRFVLYTKLDEMYKEAASKSHESEEAMRAFDSSHRRLKDYVEESGLFTACETPSFGNEIKKLEKRHAKNENKRKWNFVLANWNKPLYLAKMIIENKYGRKDQNDYIEWMNKFLESPG